MNALIFAFIFVSASLVFTYGFDRFLRNHVKKMTNEITPEEIQNDLHKRYAKVMAESFPDAIFECVTCDEVISPEDEFCFNCGSRVLTNPQMNSELK